MVVEVNAKTMTTYHEKTSKILNLILEIQDVQLAFFILMIFICINRL